MDVSKVTQFQEMNAQVPKFQHCQCLTVTEQHVKLLQMLVCIYCTQVYQPQFR